MTIMITIKTTIIAIAMTKVNIRSITGMIMIVIDMIMTKIISILINYINNSNKRY